MSEKAGTSPAIDSLSNGDSDSTPERNRRLLSLFFGSKVPPVPKENAGVYPESSANILSRITFSWVSPILRVRTVDYILNSFYLPV